MLLELWMCNERLFQSLVSFFSLDFNGFVGRCGPFASAYYS